jgi:predicted lipid-binding transport protein (Tim44 family)
MNTPYLTQKPGWIARVLLTVTTVGLVIVGFFFLTVALVAGALIALVIGVRLWWAIRKIRRAHADMHGSAGASEHFDQSNQSVVDGEYQVVERESTAPQLPAQPGPPGHSDAAPSPDHQNRT